jgi:hypothetical protein
MNAPDMYDDVRPLQLVLRYRARWATRKGKVTDLELRQVFAKLRALIC